jgi:hypothetical protein
MAPEHIEESIAKAIAVCETGNFASAQVILFPYVAGPQATETRASLGESAYSAIVEFYLFVTDGDMTQLGRSGGFISLDECVEALTKAGVVTPLQ